jgi:hypothetical protein
MQLSHEANGWPLQTISEHFEQDFPGSEMLAAEAREPNDWLNRTKHNSTLKINDFVDEYIFGD